MHTCCRLDLKDLAYSIFLPEVHLGSGDSCTTSDFETTGTTLRKFNLYIIWYKISPCIQKGSSGSEVISTGVVQIHARTWEQLFIPCIFLRPFQFISVFHMILQKKSIISVMFILFFSAYICFVFTFMHTNWNKSNTVIS